MHINSGATNLHLIIIARSTVVHLFNSESRSHFDLDLNTFLSFIDDVSLRDPEDVEYYESLREDEEKELKKIQKKGKQNLPWKALKRNK